jgi:hypothetical protein
MWKIKEVMTSLPRDTMTKASVRFINRIESVMHDGGNYIHKYIPYCTFTEYYADYNL